MRALDIIAESIRVGYAHPTNILNTLIELENEGGLVAVRRVGRRAAALPLGHQGSPGRGRLRGVIVAG